jgi:hypothetical protein
MNNVIQTINSAASFAPTNDALMKLTKTEVSNEQKVAEYRAQEQEEYVAMSDPNNAVKKDEIYAKYDKLISPLLETKTAKEKEKEVIEPLITPTSSSFTIDDLDKAIGDDASFFERNAKLKAAGIRSTKEQIDAASEWYANSPFKNHFPFKTVLAAINAERPGPVAQWTVNGVILYHYFNKDGQVDPSKSGDYTDLYHESWHGFTQTMLTPDERTAMYAELSKKTGSFKDYNGKYTTFADADWKQLEEFLAEDFRAFMMSGGKVSDKKDKVKNSIFRRLLNFLNDLFNGTNTNDVVYNPLGIPKIQTMYDNMKMGNMTSYNFNVDNRDKTIGALNHALTARNPEEKVSELDYESSTKIINSIDSIISDIINLKNAASTDPNKPQVYSYTTMLMKSKTGALGVYKLVESRFRNEILPKLNRDLETAKAIPDNEFNIQNIQKDIDAVTYTLNNFGDLQNLANNNDGKGVIAYHKKVSQFLSAEDKQNLFEEVDETDELIKANEKFDRPGNDKSIYDDSSPEIKYLLKSIHKYDANGKPVYNSFGVHELSESSTVWNRVARVLKGTMQPSEMYAALQKSIGRNGVVKDPIIEELLKKIGPSKTKTNAETDLWVKFWSTFNRAEIPLMQMTVQREKDAKGVEIDSYTMKIGSNNSVSRVAQNRWINFFKTQTSEYRHRDPEKFGNIYLDVKAVLDAFGTKKADGTYIFKPELAFDFFKAIGIELTAVDELKDLVNKEGLGKPKLIYGRLQELYNKKNLDKIYDIKEMFSEYPASDDFKGLPAETTLADLADKEIRFADYASNYAVTNAEGNVQFEQSLHNSMSIMIQAINSSKSYAELIETPYMAHLNIANNSFAEASIWLRSIYDMDNYVKGDPNLTGEKKNKKSDLKTPVAINLSNLSGVQIVSESGDDGVASAQADEFTKLILDFHLSTMMGRPELMRHADKGTSFSVWLNEILGKSSQTNSYVDTINFISNPVQTITGETVNLIEGYDEAAALISNYIDAELKRINKLKALSKQKNLLYDANYLREGQKFMLFEDFLSPETRALLEKYQNLNEAKMQNPALEGQLKVEVAKYFENQVNQTKKLMKKADFISKSLVTNTLRAASKKTNATNKTVKEALVRSFVVNSWIHNVESMCVVYGDIAQYKMAKEEFHKRNAGVGSTGKLFVTDPDYIDYVNKKGRLYAQSRNILEKDGTTKKLNTDGSFQSAIMADNNIASHYFKDVAEAMIEGELDKNKTPEEAAKTVLGYEVDENNQPTGKIGTIEKSFDNGSANAYFKMNEGDAQGWITFDFYRSTCYLEGSWLPEHEEMYKKIVNGEAVDYNKTLNFFPTKKFQYWGPVKTEEGQPPLMAFHKFSLFPLIPNVIKDKSLDELHTRMMEKGIDYATFESGSKISTITRIDDNGKADKDTFYKTNIDKNKREFNADGDLVPNTIFLQFLKDQLEIAPYYKGSVSFPTQMRKLIENGLMEGGVPTDFGKNIKNLSDREAAWKALPQAEKNKSEYYRLVLQYEKDLSDLTKKKMEKLVKEADIKYDAAGNAIFTEKLAEFIIKELDRQDLAEHEISFIKSGGANKLAHDLSYSLSSEKIEKVLTSIVTKRIIKQKFNGEGLIQVSGAGFENTLRGELTAEEKDKYGTNGLAFYRRGKGPNGTTAAMKVKIALQGDFLNLLYLKHSDGKDIETLDRLNEMLKNEEWLDKDNHRKMISITGPRIPTQENNSMEFAEVFEFLPKNAGNIVVLPSEIVAKSGGDFDIDKITFMMPNISSGVNWDYWTSPESNEKREKLQKETNFDLSNENVKRIVENRKAEDKSMEDVAILQILSQNSAKNVTLPLDSKSEEGLENKILDDMKNILALKGNYMSLVRPNGTDIVKPIADDLASDVMNYNPKKRLYPTDSKSIAGTRVFEIGYNMYKHTSNNIGKQTLGLGAVDNTFNTLFNRIGARMNHTYKAGNTNRRIDLLFDYNKLKDEKGNDVISLSHLLDAKGEHSISSIIAQLINGWVDIAKDAWIFNLQGNKEISPTLLFMVQAGVPLKQAVYFVSQPIVRAYVEEQKLAKTTFAKLMQKGGDDPNMFRSEARKEIFEKYLNYSVADLKELTGRADLREEFLNKRTLELTDKTNGELIEFFNPNTVEANLRKKITEFSESSKTDKPYEYTKEDEAIFLHFLEVEELAKSTTKFKMALNVDTSKSSNLFEAESKKQIIEDLRTDGKLPESIIDEIKNNSPISSFFIHDFQLKLWKNFFKIRMNDTVNSFILEKQKSKDFLKDVSSTFGESETFIGKLRNNFISFLFQNSIRNFDINAKTYKGAIVNDNYKIKDVPSLKYGVFVRPDDNGELTVYVDKAKLKQDFISLSSKTGIDSTTILPDGTVVKPAELNASAFPTPSSYYRFVMERELTRAMFPGETHWSVLLERADIKSKLDEALASDPKLENEADDVFESRKARINSKIYEEAIRDIALDNTFNSWKMFKSTESMADQFNELVMRYPDLRRDYSLINNLTGNINTDKNNANRIANIQLIDSMLDGEKLNLFHQNLKDLSDPKKIKIATTSYQEKQRIAEFFNKFAVYAFLQSGLNTQGRFALTRLVPQETFTTMMTSFMPNYLENMNELTLQKYYNKFLLVNKSKDRSRYSDYTISNFDMAKDKTLLRSYIQSEDVYKNSSNVVKARVTAAEALVKTNEDVVVAKRMTKDNSGNDLYYGNEHIVNEENKVEALGLKSAANLLETNPDKVFVANAAIVANGIVTKGATTNEAALIGVMDKLSNVIPFPSKRNYTYFGGKLDSTAHITDVTQEEAKLIQENMNKISGVIENTSAVKPVISEETRDGENVQDDTVALRPINGMVINPKFKSIVDKTINSMMQQKASGKKLVFPATGIGQYMIGADDLTGKLIGNIQPIALASFVYLSEQLFEKFDYINPNYEKVLGFTGGVNVVQEAAEVTDEMLDNALGFCFKNLL